MSRFFVELEYPKGWSGKIGFAFMDGWPLVGQLVCFSVEHNAPTYTVIEAFYGEIHGTILLDRPLEERIPAHTQSYSAWPTNPCCEVGPDTKLVSRPLTGPKNLHVCRLFRLSPTNTLMHIFIDFPDEDALQATDFEKMRLKENKADELCARLYPGFEVAFVLPIGPKHVELLEAARDGLELKYLVDDLIDQTEGGRD